MIPVQDRFSIHPNDGMRFLVIILLIAVPVFLHSQDVRFARSLVDTLSSPAFGGRGYVREGDKKAAKFLGQEFSKLQLIPFGKSYEQVYHFPMNTLPGKLGLTINKKTLVPGREFQVWAASPNLNGTFRIRHLPASTLKNPGKLKRYIRKDHSGHFICIDKKGITDKSILSVIDSLRYTNFLGARGLIFVSDQKLSWSVMSGARQRNYPVVDILRSALPEKSNVLDIEVESRYYKEYQSRNILGYVEGYAQPDTFLVLTAHFDHLGQMGAEVYYPGANDNASGTAMVLDLARHYSRPENKPYYSMAFFLFSGEEAGLKGSGYCASHPPFPLSRARFLVNIDMVGTGSEGIMVVNATRFREAYQRMVNINANNEYVMAVKERGESCNSDHCPFYQKGVPSFFIYSLGKEFGEYHNQDDAGSKVPFTEYEDIFRLLRDFLDQAGN